MTETAPPKWARHTSNGYTFWFEKDGASHDTLMIDGDAQSKWVLGLLNAAEEQRHATEPGSAPESAKCPTCGGTGEATGCRVCSGSGYASTPPARSEVGGLTVGTWNDPLTEQECAFLERQPAFDTDAEPLHHYLMRALSTIAALRSLSVQPEVERLREALSAIITATDKYNDLCAAGCPPTLERDAYETCQENIANAEADVADTVEAARSLLDSQRTKHPFEESLERHIAEVCPKCKSWPCDCGLDAQRVKP